MPIKRPQSTEVRVCARLLNIMQPHPLLMPHSTFPPDGMNPDGVVENDRR